MLSEAEYYKSLPRKCVGAGAMFFNNEGELLVVKPNYREYWLLPGGIVEADESPMQGCIREVKEEIGLEITYPKLVLIDYRSAADPRPEFMHFIFEGGILTEVQQKEIKLADGELDEFRFVPIDMAITLLSARAAERVAYAIKGLNGGLVVYLENGEVREKI